MGKSRNLMGFGFRAKPPKLKNQDLIGKNARI
jgi:hypothetical protein